eukprot:COSAG05_NODE_175_length_14930_cov_7.138679_8_plen_53_part_00
MMMMMMRMRMRMMTNPGTAKQLIQLRGADSLAAACCTIDLSVDINTAVNIIM